MPIDKRRKRSRASRLARGKGPRLSERRTRRSDVGTLGGKLGIPGNLKESVAMFATTVRTLEHLLQKELPTTLSTSLK